MAGDDWGKLCFFPCSFPCSSQFDSKIDKESNVMTLSSRPSIIARKGKRFVVSVPGLGIGRTSKCHTYATQSFLNDKPYNENSVCLCYIC